MNLLAHLALSPEGDPEVALGNLLGDCFKGRIDALSLSDSLKEGLRLHRAIDVYTEEHDGPRASATRLRPVCGRYAGVTVDMLYDHLLARSWETLRGGALREFIDSRLAAMTPAARNLPEMPRNLFHKIVEHDILYTYRHADGLAYALERMNKRLRSPVPSDEITAMTVDHDWPEFGAFWRDVTARFAPPD